MRRSSLLRTAGIVVISVGVVAAVAGLVVRDQISRHRRNLFSSHPLKRFAALGYLSGSPASVELVQMLRDFSAWEPNSILRRRAQQILARMERRLERNAAAGMAG
ncbi:MAG TPA: hypothetical protein VMN60_08800 [Longimicrobiales bacterium]|nr:hypothetical protein [Longimicrobiales bacterium]